MSTSRPRLPRILAQVLAAKAALNPRPALSQKAELAAVRGTSEKQLALNSKRLLRKLELIIEPAVQPGTVLGGWTVGMTSPARSEAIAIGMGIPSANVVMMPSCQPPSAFSPKAPSRLVVGTFQNPLMTRFRLTSKSDSPLFRL